MGFTETGPKYDVDYISLRRQYQCYLNIILGGGGSRGGVVESVELGGVVEVVGSNFAGGEIFSTTMGSVDLLY